MTLARTLFEFDDSYARQVPSLSVPWKAAPVPAPELLVLNEELAAELGVDAAALRQPPRASPLLAGNGVARTARRRWRRPTPATSSAATRRASATAGRCCWAR